MLAKRVVVVWELSVHAMCSDQPEMLATDELSLSS